MSTLVKKLFHRLKGFAADSSWQLTYDVVALFTTMISFYFLQNNLGDSFGVEPTKDLAQRYGPYVLIYAILGPIGGLTYSGVGIALFQRVKQYNDDPNQALKRFLSLYSIVSIIGAFVAVVIASIVMQGRMTIWVICLFVFSELFGRAYIVLTSWLVQSQKGYGAAVRVRLALELIKLVSFCFLVAIGSFTLTTIALAMAIGYFIYTLICLFWFLPKAGLQLRLGRSDSRTLKESAVFSLPMAAAMMQADGDKVVLGLYSEVGTVSDTELGQYGAVYRLVHLGLTPIRALDAAAFPRFMNQGKGKNFYLKRAGAFASMLFVVSAAIACIVFFLRPVFVFMFGEELEEAMYMLPWLLPMIPLSALSGTPMNGLLGLGKNLQRSLVYASSSVVSITLYFLIIPTHGWRGAAIATILSEAFLTATSWGAMVYYQRKQNKKEQLESLSISSVSEGDPA